LKPSLLQGLHINQETQATDSKGRVHIVNSYMEDGTDTNWASSRRKAVYTTGTVTWMEHGITT
jgi:hypothetical protein